MEIHSQAIAILTARLFLGILFFFQGYDKVIRIGIKKVANEFRNPSRQKNIPYSILQFITFITSYMELIGGLLLILGLFKYFSLYILCLDIIIVSIAFSITKPMWDMQFVFPRLVLLILLLAVPAEWDIYMLDRLF